MKRHRPASLAWFGLVSYVVVVDVYLITQEINGRDGYSTMSTVFKEAVRHPVKRFPLLLAWATLTLHLFPILYPERYYKYEPITFIGRHISGTRRASERNSSQSS
jgi:hypothetical protein